MLSDTRGGCGSLKCCLTHVVGVLLSPDDTTEHFAQTTALNSSVLIGPFSELSFFQYVDLTNSNKPVRYRYFTRESVTVVSSSDVKWTTSDWSECPVSCAGGEILTFVKAYDTSKYFSELQTLASEFYSSSQFNFD